ncbi:hypothetical protein CC80DRAFT_541457 [Byssothecium circinans]|uniref:Uncharacterized protein n=1 Tax=Byssothecium circinans TaxID=147558 RepID=A0A6A5UF36_9PLEO|nr:hypothetical protein CC80DRAFT_541457 [Byssothecium circinans]
MAMMEDWTITPCSTPPLPIRHPDHRWYPTFSPRSSTTTLIPQPLFSKRTNPQIPAVFVTIHDIPTPSPSPASSLRSVPRFPSSISLRTYDSRLSLSPPATPPLRRCIVSSLFRPPDELNWNDGEETIRTPKRALRRKTSPRKETLRSLRIKESEACLQRVYDQRLDAYLNGYLSEQAMLRGELEVVDEEREG